MVTASVYFSSPAAFGGPGGRGALTWARASFGVDVTVQAARAMARLIHRHVLDIGRSLLPRPAEPRCPCVCSNCDTAGPAVTRGFPHPDTTTGEQATNTPTPRRPPGRYNAHNRTRSRPP